MIDWRDDEADEAEFDKGFEKFIKDRGIKVFKRDDLPPQVPLEVIQSIEPD